MERPPSNRKIFLFLFILVLLIAIAFRIYKAHHTGIIYDEAWTYGYFGNNIKAMLSPQPEPHQNYHILTSILNCYSYKLFGGYEHFIRIPSLISGIIFSLSLAYIIYKAISSYALRFALLALTSLQFFVFDLSFLARGYALGLGAIYAGIAFIIWLLENRIKYKHLWIPVAAVSLMNFIAFGSMVSTMWLLFSINVIFILLYSPNVFTNPPNRRNPVILNLISIPLLSFLGLYMLYKNIYRGIFFASGRYTDKYCSTLFFSYTKQLLIDMFINYDSIFSVAVLGAFVLIIVISLLFLTYKQISKLKSGTLHLHLARDDCGIFILLVTVVTLSAMFVHRTILNMSIGYLRNGVFLIPMALLSVGILLDRTWSVVARKLLSRTLLISTVCIILLLTLQNLPSPHVVKVFDWGKQSISGPLLRRLKRIDPDRVWRITLTKTMKFTYLSLQYYRQFGYKSALSEPQNCDVLVYYKTDEPKTNAYLDGDYFSSFNCFVGIGPAFPQTEVFPSPDLKNHPLEKK